MNIRKTYNYLQATVLALNKLSWIAYIKLNKYNSVGQEEYMKIKHLKKLYIISIITGIICMLCQCLPAGGPETLDLSKVKPVEEIPYTMVVSNDLIRELAYMFARTRSLKAEVLVKPGMNPLTYKPTDEDKKAILEADVFLYMGLGLEPGLAPFISRIKKKTRCIPITAGLDKELLIQSDIYDGGYDPHIWWGPDVWEKLLYNVMKIFSTLDTGGKEKYVNVYLRYGESTNLFHHRFMKLWMDAIPKEKKYLVTLHPAFTYLNRLYGITVKSILAPFKDDYTESRINECADFIILHKIPVIFPEVSYSTAPLEAVKRAVADKGYKVTIGPEIYSYFLSQDMKTKDYTYLGAGRIMGRAIYDALKITDVPGVPD